MKLPYNSPYVAKKIQTYSNDFNVNAAVDYAKIYAVNPNTDNYGYLDADCTNFASQIMENGGIQQEKHGQNFLVGGMIIITPMNIHIHGHLQQNFVIITWLIIKQKVIMNLHVIYKKEILYVWIYIMIWIGIMWDL